MEGSIYHILLVDDDEDDYIVTRDLLKDAERTNFQLDWVNTYELALATSLNPKYAAYLFDYRLGRNSGLELLQEVIQRGCQKPIILLTGLGDDEIDRQAMKMGAEDYLIKCQIDTHLLERSILHAIERKQAKEKQAELFEELKTVNQELTNFAYIVSHDLKAPLRGIASLTDWLISDYTDSLDESGKQMLNLLGQRTRRMSDLINGILEYSRVGRFNQNSIMLDPQQIIAISVKSLDLTTSTCVTIETDLPKLFANRTKIEQVFQNLISNAVSHNDKTEPKIRIGCIDAGKSWQFYVADNGPGIESRYFEKIFQIFQTLVAPDSSNSTGIGLAIVKKIIESYNGKIWVESEIGQGATFCFTLPKIEVIPEEFIG
jgi:signal transduction histidine kinase